MVEFAPHDVPILRAWAGEADAVRRRVAGAIDDIVASGQVVRAAYDALLVDAARERFDALPLDTLTRVSTGRLSLGRLHAHDTLGRIADWGERRLAVTAGLGPADVRRFVAAYDTLWRSVLSETTVRLRYDPADPSATALLVALQRYVAVRAVAEPAWDGLQALSARLASDLAAARPLGRGRWWRTNRTSREIAAAAATRLRAVLDDPHTPALVSTAAEVHRRWTAPPTDPWPDFQAHAADVYAVLGTLVPVATPEDQVQGFLTETVVAAVRAQDLDTSLLRVDLRGYQSFGARFALVQRRVILGDEMGLGKTIEALAALCHLAARSQSDTRLRALVVCPASVLANWEREIAARTGLDHTAIHGEGRSGEAADWLARGGVGVTTYDTAKTLALPAELRLDALVVDEAQFVKNPKTGRAGVVRRLAAQADNVWFLTGTPMENRVSEFAVLVRDLQSDALPPGKLPFGPVAFRRAVSPVYIRRNATEVLAELPDRIDQDEWVRFTPADAAAYDRAVGSGNLMAIRQAGYVAPGAAKLTRVVELVTEAAEGGLKSVAYSFFLAPLERVRTAVTVPTFGPLTGDVPPARRQAILDAFSTCPTPALLLAEIRVGGVGLNIQAASVVILLEPQLTPSAEEQAIDRSYRMGQVRPVQVHRILAEDSVDASIRDLLTAKRRDFDTYARQSAVADADSGAVDVTLEGLTRNLVAAEQSRDLT